MTLPRSVELRWQEDVIERWLHTPGVPADAHANLLEMLRELKDEMNNLAPAQRKSTSVGSALQAEDKTRVVR
jgi:hypothetical protein